MPEADLTSRPIQMQMPQERVPGGPLAAASAKPPATAPPAPAFSGPAPLHPYSPERFEAAGTLVMGEKEAAVLSAPLEPEEVSCDAPGEFQRKDGTGQPMMYLSHGNVRARLCRAFGPGGWALIPIAPPSIKRISDRQSVVVQEWELRVRGVYVSRAVGECVFNPTNPKMTETDALEGAKSNALTRCCKDLGIGMELFSQSGREALRAKLPGAQRQQVPTPHQREENEAAPTSTQPAAPATASAEGAVWTGLLAEVLQHPGKKGPWYSIKTADGGEFTTFDRGHADLAARLASDKTAVRIEYRTKGQYRNVVSIVAVPEDDAVGSEPGEQG